VGAEESRKTFRKPGVIVQVSVPKSHVYKAWYHQPVALLGDDETFKM
jgi:hypothetical protein